MPTFNECLRKLYRREFNGVTYDLILSAPLEEKLRRNVSFMRWSDTTRQLVRETAENLIDAADDAQDWRDFEMTIEEDGAGAYATSLGAGEGREFAADLWDSEYRGYMSQTVNEIAACALDDMAQEVFHALIELFKEWEEEN
ncbi:hypothetical protein [Brevibacterium moorei]|uniref:hypothetical protein n=1 Tax=Brevibacterium moorei TaxID=2968457 RepID=UPI00211C1BA6|nr:hypothetical protein [Brevibacterium sp. 68QC2CO]MCQ9385134.1 hypothetical protein [Brevibacterium sp. 68QC2CO]